MECLKEQLICHKNSYFSHETGAVCLVILICSISTGVYCAKLRVRQFFNVVPRSQNVVWKQKTAIMWQATILALKFAAIKSRSFGENASLQVIFLKKWKISLFQENEGCHLWRVWHKIVTDKLFLVIPLDSATYYFCSDNWQTTSYLTLFQDNTCHTLKNILNIF